WTFSDRAQAGGLCQVQKLTGPPRLESNIRHRQSHRKKSEAEQRASFARGTAVCTSDFINDGFRQSRLAGGATVWLQSAIRQQPVVDMAGCEVAPRNIADAIVVEIPDADRNCAGGMRADIDTAGPLAVLDQPDVDVVGRRIVPGDVAHAVVVEVAGPE